MRAPGALALRTDGTERLLVAVRAQAAARRMAAAVGPRDRMVAAAGPPESRRAHRKVGGGSGPQDAGRGPRVDGAGGTAAAARLEDMVREEDMVRHEAVAEGLQEAARGPEDSDCQEASAALLASWGPSCVRGHPVSRPDGKNERDKE
ncbi:hypothetical protein Vretimale_6524 [Volvox reticuliferus]|uniref:Uncharacterized protein n=1 Tax=Volvox reticuliferus TaxID=1737510 RepID=A0A8J4FM88_9CHLO|nr:hypothetical protein Vretifemale_7412 [Volvox reticuliferus]GIL77950.1 hypothetical protein Vretifemale_7415 [Volvox reticuliferus]GIM01733.1 hypothetical protein Vretimale_6521 [Volvox reticuliferus]GIM01739.1 hypothetical protein Vretimale_6524 [Volvox reticuliferus]